MPATDLRCSHERGPSIAHASKTFSRAPWETQLMNLMRPILGVITSRTGCFISAWLFSVALCSGAVRELLELSLNDYRYSHIVLIPLISAAVVLWKKQQFFLAARWQPKLGATVALLGTIAYAAGRSSRLDAGGSLRISALALVVVWIAVFISCYGSKSFKAALFPLLFLLLVVPAPGYVLERVIVTLQRGSAEICAVLFKVVGLAAAREGTIFSLPGVKVEIAKECSSIRSGTALFLTSLLAGYIFIRSPWRRAFLCALTVPIAMFTNAIRITILSWLSVNVDQSYLYGRLHHEGGALFSLISVMALLLAIRVLTERRLEQRSG